MKYDMIGNQLVVRKAHLLEEIGCETTNRVSTEEGDLINCY